MHDLRTFERCMYVAPLMLLKAGRAPDRCAVRRRSCSVVITCATNVSKGGDGRGGSKGRDENNRRRGGGGHDSTKKKSAEARLASWRQAGRVPDVVEAGKVMRELADEGNLEKIEEVLELLKKKVRPKRQPVSLFFPPPPPTKKEKKATPTNVLRPRALEQDPIPSLP